MVGKFAGFVTVYRLLPSLLGVHLSLESSDCGRGTFGDLAAVLRNPLGRDPFGEEEGCKEKVHKEANSDEVEFEEKVGEEKSHLQQEGCCEKGGKEEKSFFEESRHNEGDWEKVDSEEDSESVPRFKFHRSKACEPVSEFVQEG